MNTAIAEAMQNGLGQSLSLLEEKRQSVLSGNKKIGLIAGGGGLLVSTLMALLFNPIAGIIVGAVALIVAFAWTSSRKNKLKAAFKDEAIPVMLKAVLPGFQYSSKGFIGVSEFNETGLYASPDRYSGKDLFSGEYGKTHLKFSLVHAEEKYETTTTDTDSDGKTTTRTETHWRDIYSGLFFSADFNKHFNGRTLVKAGKAGLLSGLFGNLVKMEDPRFSQRFAVYSQDQIEARYILTPALMERLLSLQSTLGDIQVAFVGSRVVVFAGQVPYNAFEPDIKTPFTNPAQVENMLGWITCVVGIVDDLDLNTRIWTKR